MGTNRTAQPQRGLPPNDELFAQVHRMVGYPQTFSGRPIIPKATPEFITALYQTRSQQSSRFAWRQFMSVVRKLPKP